MNYKEGQNTRKMFYSKHSPASKDTVSPIFHSVIQGVGLLLLRLDLPCSVQANPLLGLCNYLSDNIVEIYSMWCEQPADMEISDWPTGLDEIKSSFSPRLGKVGG